MSKKSISLLQHLDDTNIAINYVKTVLHFSNLVLLVKDDFSHFISMLRLQQSTHPSTLPSQSTQPGHHSVGRCIKYQQKLGKQVQNMMQCGLAVTAAV